MSEEVTQSLRMATLDAWTVTDPEMFFPSTTAPLLVTVIEPDGASCEQLAPVVVASGNPHACGLATQSIPRARRPAPLARPAGAPRAAGCGPGPRAGRPARAVPGPPAAPGRRGAADRRGGPRDGRGAAAGVRQRPTGPGATGATPGGSPV